MKDILIFLWVFIVPITIGIGQFICSLKKNQEHDPFQIPELRIYILKVYALLIILLYVIGISYFNVLRDSNPRNFSQEMGEHFLYNFCIFQVIMLDGWFLIFTKFEFLRKKIFCFLTKLEFVLKSQKFFISKKNMSFMIGFLIACALIWLHYMSVQDIFQEHVFPLWLIICILLFRSNSLLILS